MAFDFNLVGGAKLLETCFRYLGGGLLEPMAIRRIAEAKAEEIETIGKAKQLEEIRKIDTEALKALRQRELLDNFPELAEISPEFQEFAKKGMSRVIVQEARRQQNIEATIGQAYLALPDDSKVNDEPVEEDWVNNFFENCKDIGDVQMQALWGKLLAGEVAQPGSYSPRTLAILKLMNKGDVLRFEKFWTFVWAIDRAVYMAFNGSLHNRDLLRENDLLPWSRMHLEGIGLLKTDITYAIDSEASKKIFYEADIFKIENKKNDSVLMIGDVLTPVGMELSRVATAKPNYQYRDEILKMFAQHGLTVTHIEGPNPPA